MPKKHGSGYLIPTLWSKMDNSDCTPVHDGDSSSPRHVLSSDPLRYRTVSNKIYTVHFPLYESQIWSLDSELAPKLFYTVWYHRSTHPACSSFLSHCTSENMTFPKKPITTHQNQNSSIHSQGHFSHFLNRNYSLSVISTVPLLYIKQLTH